MKAFRLNIFKDERPINSMLIHAKDAEDVKDFFKDSFANCDAKYEQLPGNPIVVLTPDRKEFFKTHSEEFKMASGRLSLYHQELYDVVKLKQSKEENIKMRNAQLPDADHKLQTFIERENKLTLVDIQFYISKITDLEEQIKQTTNDLSAHWFNQVKIVPPTVVTEKSDEKLAPIPEVDTEKSDENLAPISEIE